MAVVVAAIKAIEGAAQTAKHWRSFLMLIGTRYNQIEHLLD
jgi:hypothetical protein